MSSIDPEDLVLEQLRRNLAAAGHPARSVAFPLEKVQALCSSQAVDLDIVLDRLQMLAIPSRREQTRLIFPGENAPLPVPAAAGQPSPAAASGSSEHVGGLSALFQSLAGEMNLDPATLASMSSTQRLSFAQKLASSMSDSQRQSLMQAFQNLDPRQKEDLLKQFQQLQS